MWFFVFCFVKAVHWAKAKRHLIKVLYTPLGQVIETASRFWIFGVDLKNNNFLQFNLICTLSTSRIFHWRYLSWQVISVYLNEGTFKFRVNWHWFHKLKIKCVDMVKHHLSSSLSPQLWINGFCTSSRCLWGWGGGREREETTFTWVPMRGARGDLQETWEPNCRTELGKWLMGIKSSTYVLSIYGNNGLRRCEMEKKFFSCMNERD